MLKEQLKKFYRKNKILGGAFKKRDDDIMLVSYPKSGVTWLRFLLANSLYPNKEVTFHNINELVPDIYKTRHTDLLKVSTPRILKSHEPFDKDYNKVIHLVRDPRSVAVSNYFYHIKIGLISRNLTFKEYLPKWLNGETVHLGTWAENVGSWVLAKKGHPDYLLVKYEELSQQTALQLQKILGFLHVKVHRSPEVQKAVRNSSFEWMRALKESSHEEGSQQSIRFVREGSTEGWKKHFTKGLEEELCARFKYVMHELGYST